MAEPADPIKSAGLSSAGRRYTFRRLAPPTAATHRPGGRGGGGPGGPSGGGSSACTIRRPKKELGQMVNEVYIEKPAGPVSSAGRRMKSV